jgi:serine/threonine protein kinase
MEYVECGDLSQYITDRKKVLAGAKTITRQILEGLVILHGEGICHRDLKPQVFTPHQLSTAHVPAIFKFETDT